MARLQAGEAIQYVVGKAEFCGYVFRVNRHVLIPRPETELLVREAIKQAARVKQRRIPYGRSAVPVRVLDLCTGSGNIAWTVTLAVPGAHVVGVDNSEEALSVARSQHFSEELKASGAQAPAFVNADVLDPEQPFNFGEFDLILSNPPYVMDSESRLMRKNVLDYEPASALFVPDADALRFYRAIARWSERFLTPEGQGLTEINESLGKETEALFRERGFLQTDIVKDFYDKNRFIFYAK
jgi:release factor glutamine methyltransferase